MSKTATAHTAKGDGQKEQKAPSRNLNPLKFMDFAPSELKLFSRLVVLTKDGTQPCVYTNKQAVTDLKITEATLRDAFKRLQAKGYITAEHTTTAFGANTRVVKLTQTGLDRLLSAGEVQRPEGDSNPVTNPTTNPAITPTNNPTTNPTNTPTSTPTNTPTNPPLENGLNMPLNEASRSMTVRVRSMINEFEQRSHSPSNSSLSSSGPSGSDQLANEQETQAQEGQAQGKQEQVAQTAQAGKAQGWSSSDKEGTTRFDFADKLKSLGLEVSVIDGKPSDLRYDFTWLQERLSSNAKHDYKGVCQFAMKDGAAGIPYEWIHRFAEFVIVNEMANHSDQLFKTPESCDKYNKELVTEFFARNQSGILFTVIGSRWGAEWGPYFTEVDSVDEFSGQIEHDIYDVYWAGKEFVKQALYNFNLGDRSNPVKYLTRAVLYEVRNILRDPAAYQKAVKAVASEFFFNCRAQRWINSLHYGGEEYLRCYYPVSDYDMHRMLYEPARGQKIKMRFTYPYMLVRKWFTVFRASGYEDGGGDWSDDKSRKLLYAIGHDAFNRTQWEECVKVFGAEYPFLTKLEYENV